jgi:hypothetical protein
MVFLCIIDCNFFIERFQTFVYTATFLLHFNCIPDPQYMFSHLGKLCININFGVYTVYILFIFKIPLNE